ncbi:MAG: membrane protein insertase YidC, partial [Gammaproteobacteria bacterium]
MNDIRRTILWVIFGFSMVLLWDQWQVYNGHKPTFFPSAPVTAKAHGTAPGQSNAVPVVRGATSPAESAAQLPGTTATPPGTAAASTIAPAVHQQVVVTTDVFRLTFDTEGGSVIGVDLLKYPDDADKSRPLALLEDNKDHEYVAQTGLIAGAGGGTFPTHKTIMTVVPGVRTLQPGVNDLTVKFESPDLGGVKLVKTYTLHRDSYAISVKLDVVNTGTVPVSPQLYMQLVRDGSKPPSQSRFASTFTGPAVYTDAKKYQKIDFKKIDENKADIQNESNNGYVAMVQHYFASAWLLGDGIPRNLFVRRISENPSLYAVGMITPLNNIAPGTSRSVEARLFAGPEEEKMLESLAPG